MESLLKLNHSNRSAQNATRVFQKNRDGVGVGAGAYVGDGTPSGSNPRGTIIFNYINIFT